MIVTCYKCSAGFTGVLDAKTQSINWIFTLVTQVRVSGCCDTPLSVIFHTNLAPINLWVSVSDILHLPLNMHTHACTHFRIEYIARLAFYALPHHICITLQHLSWLNTTVAENGWYQQSWVYACLLHASLSGIFFFFFFNHVAMNYKLHYSVLHLYQTLLKFRCKVWLYSGVQYYVKQWRHHFEIVRNNLPTSVFMFTNVAVNMGPCVGARSIPASLPKNLGGTQYSSWQL